MQNTVPSAKETACGQTFEFNKMKRRRKAIFRQSKVTVAVHKLEFAITPKKNIENNLKTRSVEKKFVKEKNAYRE